MVKKSLCVLALVAALIPFAGVKAAAQDVKQTPVPSLNYFMRSQPTPRTLALPFKTISEQPTYCNPCLFYSGDLNPPDPNTNGLVNGCTVIYGLSCTGNDNTVAEILAAFNVPSGQTWTVTGVFSNSLSTDSGTIDPAGCYWGIFTGVASGVKGTRVAEGVHACTSTPTGRNAFGLNEYTALIPISKGAHGKTVTLAAGTYFLTAQPTCTSTTDSNCSAQWFLSDVEPVGGFINEFPAGVAQPVDDSFIESSAFGFNYSPTWGSSGACAGIGCDQFSDGLIGTCTGTGCPTQ